MSSPSPDLFRWTETNKADICVLDHTPAGVSVPKGWFQGEALSLSFRPLPAVPILGQLALPCIVTRALARTSYSAKAILEEMQTRTGCRQGACGRRVRMVNGELGTTR